MREVAKDMQDEDKRRTQLGLSDEEEAFYEIIAHHKTAIFDFEVMKDLVKEITVTIKKNLKVDWHKTPELKGMIMLSVKRTLQERGTMASAMLG